MCRTAQAIAQTVTNIKTKSLMVASLSAASHKVQFVAVAQLKRLDEDMMLIT